MTVPGAALVVQARQMRQDLNRLAEAHVVRQTSADLQLRERAEPRVAVRLIGAQRAQETRRRCERCDLLKGRDPFAELDQPGDQRVRVERFQHGLGHADLPGRKAQGSAAFALGARCGRRQRGKPAPALQPFVGQQAAAAVSQFDDLTAARALEQLRQRDARRTKLSAALDLEPIQPRFDANVEARQ